MSKNQPTESQKEAIQAITSWFKKESKKKQIFRLFGYAGTGKTTITRLAIEELGLSLSDVSFAAFTGKAALVMNRHGIPASTIHRLIYRVREKDRTKYRELKQKIKGTKDKDKLSLLQAELRKERRELQKPIFELNYESKVVDCKLIVLDEVSMVGSDLGRDLLSFGKPILVLGDPGQLPPIKDTGFFTDCEPDVLLTEIHRQAAESPIIQLATMARQGVPIPPKRFSPLVLRTSRRSADPHHLLNADQVICSRNATRRKLNWRMKQTAGFDSVYPTGSGEKLICLKNRHDLGLLNGMFLELSHVRDLDHLSFSARVTLEDGTELEEAIPFYKGHFDQYVEPDEDRYSQDYFQIRDFGLAEIDWGYAITCHKAQGSQWKNIVVVNEGYGRSREDYSRWLYTAITRAEEGLVILG